MICMEQLRTKVLDCLDANLASNYDVLYIRWLFIVMPLILWLHTNKSHQFVRLLRHDDDCLGQDAKSGDVTQIWNGWDFSVTNCDKCDHNEVQSFVKCKLTVVVKINVPVFCPVWIVIYWFQALTILNLLKSSSAKNDDQNQDDKNDVLLPINIIFSKLILVMIQKHNSKISNPQMAGYRN